MPYNHAMFTTAYQTNAKPRGRRGSHGEAAEKQTRSRASSSASMKLSKSMSRTLEEVSVPRNSRPSSPATYIYRSRTLDSRSSDPAAASLKQSTGSLKSEKIVPSRVEIGTGSGPESPTKLKAPMILQEPIRRSDASLTGVYSVSSPEQPDTTIVEAFETNSAEPASRSTEPLQPSQGLGRKSQSSRSLASMQPTVTEEPDEHLTTQRVFNSPKIPVSSPHLSTAAGPSPREYKASFNEDVPFQSPSTSKSSLHDHPPVSVGRLSSSSLHDPLVAPSAKGSVTFIQPSLNQHPAKSGEGEANVPIFSSPALGADRKALHDIASNSPSPLGSPPISPYLHQRTGSPPPQPVPYQQPYPYPPAFIGSPQFQPLFYPPQFASPVAPLPHFEAISRSGSAGLEDERTKLLEKVSNVLPEINRLLQYYQESQGLLSEKDHLVQQAESQHLEEVTKLHIEMSASKEEYERLIGEQASENLKLKSEITEQAERILFLENSSSESAVLKKELANLKLECRSLEEEGKNDKRLSDRIARENKALETEIENLKRALSEDRAEHEIALAELRTAHEKQMLEKEDDHARVLHEHKAGLSKIQLDLAGMITKHTQQKKDLDSARLTISELEHSVTARAKEMADALQSHKTELEARSRAAEERAEQHKQEISVWSRELAHAIAKHEEEVQRLRESHQTEVEQAHQAAESHLSQVTAEHERRESQLQKELAAAQSEVAGSKIEVEKERSAHTRLKNELESAQRAHESLKTQHDLATKHHGELAESMLSLRTKQAEWHRESERMDRILQSLGQLGPGKSKDQGRGFL